MGYCSFEQADMKCEGCFSIKNKDSKMCGDCKIRQCADTKNHDKNYSWVGSQFSYIVMQQ